MIFLWICALDLYYESFAFQLKKIARNDVFDVFDVFD